MKVITDLKKIWILFYLWSLQTIITSFFFNYFIGSPPHPIRNRPRSFCIIKFKTNLVTTASCGGLKLCVGHCFVWFSLNVLHEI